MTDSAIAHRTGTYYSETEPMLIWEVRDERDVAAELYVSVDRHEIMQIDVRADRRRVGLARTLYTAATAQIDIYHAPIAHRTEEGDAFAEAVGGPTAEYPCDCYGCSIDDEES